MTGGGGDMGAWQKETFKMLLFTFLNRLNFTFQKSAEKLNLPTCSTKSNSLPSNVTDDPTVDQFDETFKDDEIRFDKQQNQSDHLQPANLNEYYY